MGKLRDRVAVGFI